MAPVKESESQTEEASDEKHSTAEPYAPGRASARRPIIVEAEVQDHHARHARTKEANGGGAAILQAAASGMPSLIPPKISPTGCLP